jgi:hypothetical protein
MVEARPLYRKCGPCCISISDNEAAMRNRRRDRGFLPKALRMLPCLTSPALTRRSRTFPCRHRRTFRRQCLKPSRSLTRSLICSRLSRQSLRGMMSRRSVRCEIPSDLRRRACMMSDPQRPNSPYPSQPDGPAPRPEPVLPPSGAPSLPGDEDPGGIPPTTPADSPNPKEPLGGPPTTPQEMPTRTPSFPQPQA